MHGLQLNTLRLSAKLAVAVRPVPSSVRQSVPLLLPVKDGAAH
jgi:hypothetical protein